MNDEEIRRVLGLLHQDDTLRAFASLVLGQPLSRVRSAWSGWAAAGSPSGTRTAAGGRGPSASASC
ncbi:hypothetical protein [Nonomuraea recticatena]|uniref:hypothetical protein n=1 Tax=Nonomuraea recticatena TaxID=46178 RepID=UPI003621E04C